MQFYTDDDNLRAGVRLNDRDHKDLDLTRGGLGRQLLDCLIGGMLDAHACACAPDGTPWAPLRDSTVRRKGHSHIGIDSGRTHLLDPTTWTRDILRSVTSREAYIEFPRQDRRWGQVHGWQNGHPLTRVPARKLIGWTRAAQADAQQLLTEATFRAGE
jgi:hypothetical protein